jgi:threonine/homoserine/homoserine lactone efflux protein
MTESILILGKGLLTGLLISIPPGVIMIISIRRTLSKGLKSGFVTSLGAAAGNTIAAIIAAFFLGIVLPFIEENFVLLKIVFGIIIITLGINILIKRTSTQFKNIKKRKGVWNDFISVFVITLANPGFVLAFIAFFAYWGIKDDWIDFVQGFWLIGGVLIGSAAWWFSFNIVINKLRNKFKLKYIKYMNKGSAIAFILLGIIAIVSSL